jgi:hypothetical protein
MPLQLAPEGGNDFGEQKHQVFHLIRSALPRSAHNIEWWRRRATAAIQLETLSPVATQGLIGVGFAGG